MIHLLLHEEYSRYLSKHEYLGRTKLARGEGKFETKGKGRKSAATVLSILRGTDGDKWMTRAN